MTKLTKLVQSAFICHYKGKDIEAIKNLDDITQNISVLSRSGNNIASNLSIY